MHTCAQQIEKGKLIYSNSLNAAASISDWRMEGAGRAVVDSAGMHLFSVDQMGHHVFWCPQVFPERFIAEWEVKNENPMAGLCIIFFAAKGHGGQSIFDSSLKPRNGVFREYTKGDIDNYHISYYANTPTQKNRPFSHLRKNSGFHKVHVGKQGVPADSEKTHRMTLVKNGAHIQLYLDSDKIIDWVDDGQSIGLVLGEGHIGFRQMKWTRFCYRNFKVWEILKAD